MVNLVNELRFAGAEAISINGVRIISMTDFADINSYIIVKPSQRLISPYVVKAIGNQTYLVSTLCLKNSGFVDQYNNSGKSVKLDKQNVYTIGDGQSDIEMIKEFNGYTMVNGIKELKEYSIKELNSVSELLKELI